MPYCSPCESFHDESTCAIARGILGSGIVGTSGQINNVIEESHCLPIEYHDNNLVKELIQMIKDMQSSQVRLIADHTREMSSMENMLHAMEVTQYNQRISFQNTIETLKDDHAQQIRTMEERQLQVINVMEVNFSEKIKTMEHNDTQEMKSLEAKHFTLQDRFGKTKINQAKLIVRHAKEMSAMQKRLEEMKELQKLQPNP